MTTGSIGPGTVLAGRYRLDDLLAESDGARFWRATDTVLARSVAIHAVPSDDARATALLDGARVSATVIDAHLLRVLDCDDTDGTTWVVNEWGDGVSLDLMLEQGPLPPSRAAWLAREVAEAIASGHAQGVAHGRLNPEAVLVTHAGAVKLIGYVVDATLERSRPPDPLYGELDEREADVINLAGILYAALTGRWPGVAVSAVPTAPREARRPLRPRQVRAGVPRTLDAICERVLHKEASLHTMPIETAYEIAAALSDFVGDPALSAPADLAGLHDEPAPRVPPPTADGDPERDTDRATDRDTDRETGAGPAPAVDPEATQVVATQTADGAAAGSTPDPAPDPGATRAVRTVETSEVAAGREPDPEETQLTSAVTDLGEATERHEPLAEDGTLRPIRGRSGAGSPTPPPPPFEEAPERPLFADTERRVPAGAATAGALGEEGLTAGAQEQEQELGTDPRLAENTFGGTAGSGYWPFVEDEEPPAPHTGREGRGWLRAAIVVGVLLVVVVAMVVAFDRGRTDGTSPSGGGSGSPSSETSPAATGQTLEIANAKDFDPEGDPPEENPGEVGKAIDGDPATSWTSLTYRGNPALGGLKSGVGLLVDLGKDQKPASVVVRFANSPTTFEVYAASAGVTDWPTSLDQLDKVGAKTDAPATSTVTLDPAPTTRYLLVWLTKLPATSGGFRGEISEITVTS